MANESNNTRSTYYTLVADRAGNTYACAFSGMKVLSSDLIKYINGEISTPTAEILFHYSDMVYEVTMAFAHSAALAHPIKTSKLLCWLKTQYDNSTKDVAFFKDKKIKRDITVFCDYFSSLSESALTEERTYHAIERRLRSIFKNICLKYSNWDYLYEVKKISPNEEDIEFEEE